jgi:hydroxyjasmonate sulfotransferase
MATVSAGTAKGAASVDGAGTGDNVDSMLNTTAPFPANIAQIVSSLPQETRSLLPSLRMYRGFWIPEFVLTGLPDVHARFEPRATDVLLASFPKSGTTWLKSLGFAAARRSVYPPSDPGHPLLHANAHDCVRFVDHIKTADPEEDAADQSPRVLATHLPYSLLPERAKADGSGCRIIYVCREPKDTLVSLWHFNVRVKAAANATAIGFDEAFELFCQGRLGVGPHWKHVLEYWEASKHRPGQVLFLRYEEMLRDPEGNLRKMANFMGCPFSEAEDEAGVVRAILDLCSMETQRNLDVNKRGDSEKRDVAVKVNNQFLFRKGVAGDWKNHMTPEMVAKLDGIVEEALQGSRFTFGTTDTE